MEKYIEEPRVEICSEQPYVGIAIQATLKEWDKVNGLSSEIYEWLARKGVEPAGALFYRYWIIGSEEEAFHMEVGVPVERMVTADERVIAGFVPGGSYVTALHCGHPSQLAKSLNELEIWATKEGLQFDKRWEGEDEIWNGRFECYAAGLDAERDPFKSEIRISYLLMGDDAA